MKKHQLLLTINLLLLVLIQACTDQQTIEPKQHKVEIILLTDSDHLQNLVSSINQKALATGRDNSLLNEVNFERAFKRLNPETGITKYSFSMKSENGLMLRKFVLSENYEKEVFGHVYVYQVNADWLVEVGEFAGWHKYNGSFSILDLDGEVIVENEIINGSSDNSNTN